MALFNKSKAQDVLEQKVFLAENPKRAEEVKKLMSKYAKGGNYFAITESALASKVLDDFQTTFIKGA